MSEWIDVSEQLPTSGRYVLMYGSHTVPAVGYRDSVSQLWHVLDCGDYVIGVTHWMKLPNIPHPKRRTGIIRRKGDGCRRQRRSWVGRRTCDRVSQDTVRIRRVRVIGRRCNDE